MRLTASQRRELSRIQRDPRVDAPSARRARIIELLGDGLGQQQVQSSTGAGIATVGRTRRRFLEAGLEASVYGYRAPGAPRLLDAGEEARIVTAARPPSIRSA